SFSLSLSLSPAKPETSSSFFFFFFFSACDGTTLHRRHRHHTPPLGAAPVRWNHHIPYFPFHPTTASIRRRVLWKQPRKVAVWTDFCKTFGLSFSLFSPPNWTSKVLRPRIRSRRDPLRVRQCGTTCGLCGLFSNLMHGFMDERFMLNVCSVIALARGDSAKIFGRKSRFLVSGPASGRCRLNFWGNA
ncbi:ZWICHEL kinesin-like calmodulin-binding protein, partial [Prunus dulcis]